jgi:hypothetical protein
MNALQNITSGADVFAILEFFVVVSGIFSLKACSSSTPVLKGRLKFPSNNF